MSDPSCETSRLPAELCELERLLAERRGLESRLLVLESEDRWGRPDAERARAMDAEAAACEAKLVRAGDELNRRVEALRSRDPQALDPWIAAQERLLDAYLAELEARPDRERVRTARFVALRERAAWAGVRAGTASFVEQNTFYVRLPRALYRALFGFDP